MRIRITILCENLVGRLTGAGEHGFSAFIETERGNYLFDTGNSHSIVPNSLTLSKDLKSIKKIFLSHGHYDHTGGLPEVLKLRGKVDVHAHPHVFLDRIAVLKENRKETKRFVGIPYKKGYLESLGANFLFNDAFLEVGKGMFLTGEVPRKTPFEKPDPRLFSEINGKTTQDIFLDDQSLLLESKKGFILILGCAHSGMINIIHHVVNKMVKGKFYAILGGTHLDFLTPEQLEESIKSLKKMEIEKIGVSHCTGMRAAFRLHQEFGDRFLYGCVGSVLEA
ncbi:MAG: MBL fold metallo-hydrolase [Deltaproteobacteria bacterium RBG_19FT_COMBO_46_12]|nr:MAG: MBL fold metallo-hydrolase [Deltaproteobacteria bacterium RBG_19FT_COMBO_46_12]